MTEYYLRQADLRKDIPLPDMTDLMDFCEQVDRKERAKENQRKKQEEDK